MRFLLLVTVLLLLPACDARRKPTAASPATSPVLAAYHALYQELGEQADIATAHVYPHKPGLVLDDDAAPASRENLIQSLERLQPQIARLIQLSTQDPGPIPAEPKGLAPDDWPRAWLNRCASILQADAGRLWDTGNANEAANRIVALIRLGNVMMKDTGELMQMWGLARAGAGEIRANAMIDSGLLKTISADTKAELVAAVKSIYVSEEHTTRFDRLAPQVQAEREKLLQHLTTP